MILDTSFLIDVLRGDEAVLDWEHKLDERGVAAITAVSVMELWEGIHLADATETERERVQALIEGLVEAPFDRPAAMLAGELNADLVDRGQRVDIEDVMIAAIAINREEAVLTRNEADFGRVSGVEVVSY